MSWSQLVFFATLVLSGFAARADYCVDATLMGDDRRYIAYKHTPEQCVRELTKGNTFYCEDGNLKVTRGGRLIFTYASQEDCYNSYQGAIYCRDGQNFSLNRPLSRFRSHQECTQSIGAFPKPANP